MAKTTTVKSANDSVFTVRLVERGDRYGLHFCLIHFETKPMIEFYDVNSRAACYDFVGPPDSAIAANAPRLGQFVTRYNVSTLLPDIETIGGLCLHGGVPAWQIDGSALRQAFHALGLWTPAVLITPPAPAETERAKIEALRQAFRDLGLWTPVAPPAPVAPVVSPAPPAPVTAEAEQAKIDALAKDAIAQIKADYDLLKSNYAAQTVRLKREHEAELSQLLARRDLEGIPFKREHDAMRVRALAAERRLRAAERQIEELKSSDFGQLHAKYTTKLERLAKRNTVLTSRLSYWKRKNA